MEGGESNTDLYNRAKDFLQKVILDVCFVGNHNMYMADMGPYKMDLLFVSHGGFIREFLNVMESYNQTKLEYDR